MTPNYDMILRHMLSPRPERDYPIHSNSHYQILTPLYTYKADNLTAG